MFQAVDRFTEPGYSRPGASSERNPEYTGSGSGKGSKRLRPDQEQKVETRPRADFFRYLNILVATVTRLHQDLENYDALL